MVLELHIFIKQNQYGDIKVLTVARVNKQPAYIPKEDYISPTVSTESVLLTIISDSEENRNVAVIDIPKSFIQTRVKEKNYMAIIKLRGVLVDILCKISS